MMTASVMTADDSQRDDSTCFEELVSGLVRIDFQAMKNPWST
jgi:hypothetical protein